MIDLINATILPHVKDKLGHRGKKARMLEIILEHFFKSKPTGVGFKKNLAQRAVDYCYNMSSKIQAIARGWHCRHVYRVKRAEKLRREKREREERKVLFIQILARKFLARMKIIEMAERIYVKYAFLPFRSPLFPSLPF
jgi:hypothetical protein